MRQKEKISRARSSRGQRRVDMSRWMRRCCCCEKEKEGRSEDEEEEEEVKLQDLIIQKSKSSSSLTTPKLDLNVSRSVPQTQWFHTLQVKRVRVRRERSNSDPLGGWGTEDEEENHHRWKAGLMFGAAHSYLSLEKLGEGAYASVYKGISRINGQLVALKVIRMKTEEGVPFTAIREASLLKGLKHANVVLLHDIIHNSETLTLVFEYVQTDLSQYMLQHPGGLHSHNIRIFMFQLLRGLTFIHSRKILHRDLKPQNLLISYLGELKLADFGLARCKSIPSQTFSADVVTLWYRPPDVLLGSTEYSTALDMWGAGCIFIEMLQGAPAFPGVTDVFEQLQKIWMVLGLPSESSWPGVTSLSNYRPEKFYHSEPKELRTVWKRLNQLPSKTEALVQRLLTLVPSERISAQESLQHPYFNTLPAPIMHLNDMVSIFKVPGIYLETEIRDVLNATRHKVKPSLLTAAPCW